MSQHVELYSHTELYDIIFERDVSAEIRFMLDLYIQQHQKSPRSALEICCGPGYHIRTLNRYGLKTFGLDRSQEMLNMAQRKASRSVAPMRWIQADMRWFRLPEPVQFAFSLLGAMQALISDDDLLQHLNAVADNLQPGGLYLVELPHPREYATPSYSPCRYSGNRQGVQAELIWATNNPPIDLVSGISQVDVELRVQNGPEARTICESAPERMILPGELRLLCRLSGRFELVGLYGDFNLEQPLDNSEHAKKMVAVLKQMPFGARH